MPAGGILILTAPLRPSDSPTRALARRFAGALRSRGSLAVARSRCRYSFTEPLWVCEIASMRARLRATRFAARQAACSIQGLRDSGIQGFRDSRIRDSRIRD